MSKNYFKSKKEPKQTKIENKVEPAPEIEPVLDLGMVDSVEGKTAAPTTGIGELESLTKEVVTPEFEEPDRYEVVAQGGVVLREAPPPDTSSASGMYAGAGIICVPYKDIFVETKRINNWSFGNYNGKSGWVCNIYLKKK